MSERKTHTKRDIFVEGAIDPAFIGESIAKHAARLDIGAHEIFLGQVRADNLTVADDLPPAASVIGIEYSAYRDMALERMTIIREGTFVRWPSMTCLHVHHSLGMVPVGQLCFMVFASAPHRIASREAVAWVVDAIKRDLPIFGKEIFSDNTYQWKHNP